MRTRGLSLFELILSLFIVAIVSGASLRAYENTLQIEGKIAKSSDVRQSRLHLEDKISSLIAGADMRDSACFFIAPIPASKTPSSNPVLSENAESSVLGPGADSLVITTWSVPPPSRYLEQTSQFEDLNGRFGAQGGLEEVAFSLNPVGDAANQTGLFLREQRPPDSDPTQGGEEQLLGDTVKDVRFEFYDGTDWQESWDSQNGPSAQKGAMPVAVRVTYLLVGEKKPRTFLVSIPIQPVPNSNSNSGSTSGSTSGGSPNGGPGGTTGGSTGSTTGNTSATSGGTQ